MTTDDSKGSRSGIRIQGQTQQTALSLQFIAGLQSTSRRKEFSWSRKMRVDFRSPYMQVMLEAEKGELGRLQQDALDSIREHEVLSQNLKAQFQTEATLGGRIAEQVC
ncbi:MAG: hypothetical protein ACI8P0_003378 [Planctomycetaceae bacterium]